MIYLETLIAAGAALAAIVIAWITVRQSKRHKRKYRLFISIQMNDLSDVEYTTIQKEILSILEFSKSMEHIEHIYYFNRNIPTKNEFNKAEFKANKYMNELDRCDYFIAVILKRVHSSIYAEAGYAMAKGKKCLFYIKKGEKVLPTVLNKSTEIYEHVRAIEFTEIAEVAEKLKEYLPNIGNTSSSMPR